MTTTSTVLPPIIPRHVFVLLVFVLGFLASLPAQGAAIRSGIPTSGNREESRKRRNRFATTKDVHMTVDVHMDVNGKEWFPLSSPVWFQKKSSNGTADGDMRLPYQPQRQGMSFLGLILVGSTGGMGGGIRSFGRKILNSFASNNLRPILLVTGAALAAHRAHRVVQSDAVRRATHFWFQCGPMVAHYKLTKWCLKASSAPLEQRDATYKRLHDKYARKAFATAVELKGLYVKLVQIASSRPDFVPQQYLSLFVQAQDSLPQWPIEDVKQIIDQTLQQLGGNDTNKELSYESVFNDIDEIALGSASIGQCHKARIKAKYARELLESDTETEHDLVDVAVKVMHPGSEVRFKHDFQVFRWLCRVAIKGWEPILDECYRQIMSEFDYRREADSLACVRKNMIASPFSKTIRVPKPVMGLCGKELLVMELLNGDKLSDSLEDQLADILGNEKSRQLLERKRLELVLGDDKLKTLDANNDNDETKDGKVTESSILKDCGWRTKLQLFGLYKRAQSTIDLLVDVQGYQMLKNGIFNGDPHPGNILELGTKNRITGSMTRLLGLIDYGQTKAITEKERLGIARVIAALGEGGGTVNLDFSSSSDVVNTRVEKIANAMRELGFVTKRDDPVVLAQYAGLFFDSDEVGKRLYDCATPQVYFKLLNSMDQLVHVPDVAVFVARCGFILRGMGTMLGKQIKTSERWSVYAKQALDENGTNDGLFNTVK